MTRESLSVGLSVTFVVLLLTSTVAAGAFAPVPVTPHDGHDATVNATEHQSNAPETESWERAVSLAVHDAFEDGDLDGDFWRFFRLVISVAADGPDRPTPEQPMTTTTTSESRRTTSTTISAPESTTESPKRMTTGKATTERPATTSSATTAPEITTPPEQTATSTTSPPESTATPETTTTPQATTTPPETTTAQPTSTTTSETTSPTTTSSESDGFDRRDVERLVHQFVNEERTERGLDPISFDTELRDIARSHSADMAARSYFSHTSPEGDNFVDRYEQAGYTCRAPTGDGSSLPGGENIAQTWYDRSINTDDGTVRYTTERELARGLVNQWMNSQGHRENILTDAWQNEGIGIYVTDDGKVYATQNFC
ncbi:CAP domain-containing protein [Haladaptatus caseinilyticus]|uniref:CAP domain-containing protein n=1 Tax=Haladaptatus caseinilyticus TaxID=2993314 RepID=UPI00224B4447|nr:CAP domain-containing protein [Haladaptatus caseinilyticus]